MRKPPLRSQLRFADKGVSPTRAVGDTQGLLALRANRPFAYTCTLRACWASFFWQTIPKKPKNLTPETSPACGRTLRCSAGTKWSRLNSRATPPLQGFLGCAQTALPFPAALRSDRRAQRLSFRLPLLDERQGLKKNQSQNNSEHVRAVTLKGFVAAQKRPVALTCTASPAAVLRKRSKAPSKGCPLPLTLAGVAPGGTESLWACLSDRSEAEGVQA